MQKKYGVPALLLGALLTVLQPVTAIAEGFHGYREPVRRVEMLGRDVRPVVVHRLAVEFGDGTT